jgi:type IV secretion system protein VirD4
MNHKRNKSVKRNKILVVMSIIIFDIFILPMLIKLPVFLLDNSSGAVSSWLNHGYTGALNDIIHKPIYTQIYIFLQVGIIALLISVIWNWKSIKSKNQIRDGEGGPDPSGFGQHGTARWRTGMRWIHILMSGIQTR